MKFDMVRVRQSGVVVPRHNVGGLRAVRGVLLVADQRIVDLNRHSRVATFVTDDNQRLELMDAALVHATAETLVLTGFERDTTTGREIDFAQTWVMNQCEGDRPEGTRGPPFRR